uniref:Uncharacterized protein n=1 Tax=Octopus bimaculoides TaxID=37653 RepID=A0A0L8FQR8_OCTBM
MATVGEQIQISSHTVDKVTKAKVTLENYYTNLLMQHEEREIRYRMLEQSMEEEGLSEEQVNNNNNNNNNDDNDDNNFTSSFFFL